MKIEFTEHGWEDFSFWIENDPQVAKKIQGLIRSITQDPFKGLGKPEPLRNDLKGYWSRRINIEHRLIYRVSGKRGVDQKVSIVQCRFHYKDK